MKKTDELVLVIEWDETAQPNLPTVVGPFADLREAGDWGRMNVPNGTWQVHAMSYPYMRSNGRDMTLRGATERRA
jgi:hypothetical protein